VRSVIFTRPVKRSEGAEARQEALLTAQIRQQVGHGRWGQGGFEAGGHEREAGALEGLDVGAEDDLFLADGGAQREAGGGLCGDDAGVRGGVARDDDVADVLVFNGAVGIEDGNQSIGGGLGGEEGGVRADGVALVFETMANGAVGFEQERAVQGVALEFRDAGVAGDDFGAVGVDFAEELGGARAEGGVRVLG